MTENNEVKKVIEEIKEAPEITKEKPVMMEKDDKVFLRFKNHEVVAEYNLNDRKFVKNLKLEDVASILNKNVKIDTGYLHLAGKDYTGIRRFLKCGSTEIFLIETSAGKRNILFDYERRGTPNDTIEIDCPQFLMAVVANAERAIAAEIFATKMPAVSGAVELFRFPFGNVYNDGRICWGNNYDVYQEIGKFQLLNFFLDSGFNNHLGFGINIPNLGTRDLETMVNKFKEDPVFQTSYFLHQKLGRSDKADVNLLIEDLAERYVKESDY